MNSRIEISCSESFKEDVQDAADEKEQSMSEYLREAARRQMQDDLKGQA